MINCSFILNNESMSFFQAGATKFPAFSGVGEHRNRRVSACLPNLGRSLQVRIIFSTGNLV
jgi:hypothetical protein